MLFDQLPVGLLVAWVADDVACDLQVGQDLQRVQAALLPPARVIVAVLLIWSLAPSRSVPPEFTVTLLVDPSALPEVSATVSVPPLMVVDPL